MTELNKKRKIYKWSKTFHCTLLWNLDIVRV